MITNNLYLILLINCFIERLIKHASCFIRLLKKIVKWLASDNFLVIEATLSLFEIDWFISLVKSFKKFFLPIITPILIYQSLNYRSLAIKNSFVCLSEVISEIDPDLFDSLGSNENICKESFILGQSDDKRKELDMKWEKISYIKSEDLILH